MIKIRELRALLELGCKESFGPFLYKTFNVSDTFGCKPININIEITNRCCLKCKMCGAWQSSGTNELDILEWKEIVTYLKKWLGIFRLTITGGEPFLKPGIWQFLNYCVALNLPVVVITNGFVLNDEHLKKILTARIAQIVISIDSIFAELHDEVRGIKGSYARAIHAIEFLASHRRSFLLGTDTVITKRNILDLEKIANKLSSMGADRIFFQPIQEGFYNNNFENFNLYNSSLWPSSKDEIAQGLEGLQRAKRTGVPIANSFEEIYSFKDYFYQGKAWKRPWSCNAGFTTMQIDASGNVRLCPALSINIGNILDQSPKALWQGLLAEKERKRIEVCKKACLLNCNRSYSLQEKINYGARLFSIRNYIF